MRTLSNKKAIFNVLVFLFLGIYNLNGQLNANFTAIPVSGCSPLFVNFINTSSGNPISYHWDLGNGTQSTIQSPSVTYFNPGTYTVTLIITAANGQKDTIVKPNFITVNAKPVVNFMANDTIGCYPLPVQFTDLSTTSSGTNNGWLWDFGDGISSTLQNPNHTYNQGTYTVVLRVTNDKGCSNIFVKPNYIRALNGTIANFNFSNPNNCSVPLAITFNNTSTGSGTLSYLWNFGDGGNSTLQNPSHTYTTNGSYTVSLTASNNQGCTNTYTVTNAVNIGNNNASFTSADNVCVNAPLVINNTTTPQVSNVLWNFGDGTTSTQVQPIKIYSSPGNYVIKLVADFGACKDSAFKNITVLPKPTSGFTTPSTVSCRAPFTVNFTSTSTNASTYNWSFGDGNTSSLANPVHTYNAIGNYNVTLIVTNNLGCSDTLTINDFIKIQPPAVSFINLPTSGCRALTVTPLLNLNAIDGVATYNWDFGDGFSTTSPNPVHTYTTVGNYTVTLTITTNGGCTQTLSASVGVGSKPNIQFNATPTNTCAFTPVNFTDASTGGGDFWFWDFGDGGTSFLQNPNYTYQDTGFFDVTLVVGNNGCFDTLVIPNYIYIKPPIASFTPQSNCVNPFSWNFSDQSIAPLTWAWQFGDGATSTLQSPSHVYTTAGSFNVILTVSNGSCSHTTNNVINVIDENLDFIADKVEICRNSSIQFSTTNHIRNHISSYLWNFGDGVILSGDTIINHIYTQSGNFTVTLTIVDVNGCSKIVTKNLYITVFGATANFLASAPGTCLNTPITFNDLSTTDGFHAITNWQWNYGDGNTQVYTSPPFIHQYANDGVYAVSLKVTDSYGCIDSINNTNAIVISKPVAGFNSLDTASCPNRDIAFNNTSVGSGLNFIWDFGDGITSTQISPVHQYAADGVYTIKLFVTDQYGCVDSIIQPNLINILSPKSLFIASDTFGTCPPLFVQFTNQSTHYTSFSWDFGDGSSSTALDPSHFYTIPGSYIVRLTVSSSGGCVDVYSKTIRIQGPIGTFSYNPIEGCSPLTVNFTTNAQNTSSFIYDFNNGQTNSTFNTQVSYTYTTTGKFLPRVILKDTNGCSIPILGLDSITIYDVTGNISSNKFLICDSGQIQFNINTITNDVVNNYQWSFGDGNTSNSQNPVHHYSNSGDYNINCIVTTLRGCVDTTYMNVPINVVESPIIDFTMNNGACIPATATFASQIIRNDTSTLFWHWDFGNGQTSNLMNPPSMVFPNAGPYSITSIATTSNGCKDTVTQIFNAWALPTVNAGNDIQICRFSPTTLIGTGATSYVWSPAIGLSCTNCPSTLASPDSTKYYYVVGTDVNGCIGRDSVEVKVVQPFNILNSPNVSFCIGGFTTLLASGANTYQWSPSNGLSATTGSQVIARPNSTTTYRVIGSDAFNCFKDTADIIVQVNPIPTVNAGPDITIIGGTTTTLTATTTGNIVSYNWNNGTTLSCTNCASTVAKPLQTTTYKVEVTTDGGCKNNDEVKVFIVCDKGNLFVPNTFSPNNDGVNDVMYPRGNGISIVKSFKIYNRWGELVYEQNNFTVNDASRGWNGTFKGKRLSADVFVYTIEVLCENRNPIEFKGNITLVN